MKAGSAVATARSAKAIFSASAYQMHRIGRAETKTAIS